MTRTELASIRADYHDTWLRSPSATNKCLEETEVVVGSLPNFDIQAACHSRAAHYSVVNESTVTAAFSVQGRTGILNFASAHHPGGGYLSGARAQEESLCHSSNLYEILSSPTCSGFYNARKPRGLYTSDYVYSPVIFNRDADGNPVKPRKFDVMTIAAPNLSSRAQYDTYNHAALSPAVVDDALNERIGLTLREFIRHGCINVVLGAFGCGVFANNPLNVAEIFSKWLRDDKAETHFDNIVFAVLDTTADTGNFNAFKHVFG